MSASDPELLQRFVTEASETAFGELVQRHAGLVYSVAARFPRLEPSEVEDVAQRVFVLLARKAAGLTSHPSLTAWLFTTTRQIAFRHQRSETRRIIREQKTHEMSQDNTPDGPPVDWTSLRPVIDEALGELDECDQKAVLWRYFEKQGYALIGSRLGLSEEAARKRVTRALHALHSGLSKRGVTSTAAAVGLALEVNAVMASPEGLPGRILSSMAASGAFLGSGGMLKIGVARWSGAATRVQLGVAAIGILAAGWVAYRVAHFPQSRDGARVSPETQAGLGSNDSEGALARLRSSTAARALEEAADLEDARRRLREVLRFGDGGTLLTAAINLFGERVPEAVPVLLEGLASDQPDAATASISGLKLVLIRLSAGGRESERAPILNQIRPLLGAVLADVHRPASQQSRALETLCPLRLTSSIPEDPESLLWIEKVLHETSPRQIELRFEIIDRLVMPSVYGPEAERVIRGLLPMLSSPDPADRILAAYAYALAPIEKPSAVTSVLVAAVRERSRYRTIAARF